MEKVSEPGAILATTLATSIDQRSCLVCPCAHSEKKSWLTCFVTFTLEYQDSPAWSVIWMVAKELSGSSLYFTITSTRSASFFNLHLQQIPVLLVQVHLFTTMIHRISILNLMICPMKMTPLLLISVLFERRPSSGSVLWARSPWPAVDCWLIVRARMTYWHVRFLISLQVLGDWWVESELIWPSQATLAWLLWSLHLSRGSMEYWQSYYANYPGYPPYPPCPPPYPPHDQSSHPPVPPEYSLSGASHLRVSDTDSDSGSPSRALRRNVHTSASKYAAVSRSGYDCTLSVGKSAMAMPQSQSEVSCINIISTLCLCVGEYMHVYVSVCHGVCTCRMCVFVYMCVCMCACVCSCVWCVCTWHCMCICKLVSHLVLKLKAWSALYRTCIIVTPHNLGCWEWHYWYTRLRIGQWRWQ